GVVRAIEQPQYEKTFQHRFHAWLQKYPMDYGLIDRRDGNNAFFLTMEKLNVCLPKADRLLLVAEPFLQPITANLVVQYEDDGLSYFAGTKTAIGTVPSLSWFSSVRSAKRTGNAGYKAWISTTPNLGEQVVDVQDVPARADTLSVALELLGGCFERFGFTVNTSRRLPSDMKDAGLAVVTAHGGLNRDKRYLMEHPEGDTHLVDALHASGFLDLWRDELERNAWQYHVALLEGRKGSDENKQRYCEALLADEALSQNRFVVNHAGYVILNTSHPRQYFALKVELYALLAELHAKRIKAATAWLENRGLHKAVPRELLRPHTPEWFASLREWNPKQAAMTEIVVQMEGHPDVCSLCGDEPVRDYVLVCLPETGPGTLRLCNDCFDIRSTDEPMRPF
ncbi:MAG: hypothetical protein K2X64_04905, partial [Rhodocyclaceae bacterium]|nr:hypothetical protein [Rhodocyclaceae bacterium]